MMVTELVWDPEVAAWHAGDTLYHRIHILPMLFNHRVVLTPKENPGCYDAGWCYPSLEAAVIAVSAWDFTTEPEPAGYLKAIGWALPTGHEHRRLS